MNVASTPMAAVNTSPCIGLFGTCGNSQWRKEFIADYTRNGINFYNPQVTDWKPDDAAIEAEHLVNDEIILFPVTAETYGTGSLAETGFSILSAIRSNEDRYVIIYIDQNLDAELVAADPIAAKESLRSRALVKAHLKKVKHKSVFVVDSLLDMKLLSFELLQVVNILNNAQRKYAGEK